MGSVVFLVNGEYAFKFAKHEKAAQSIRKEIDMLPEIREWVSIRIPDVSYVGPQQNRELPFLGYKLIEGIGLDKEHVIGPRGEVNTLVVEQIAEFLSQLHSFDVEVARQKGVEDIEPRPFYAEQLAEARRTVYPVLERRYSDDAVRLKRYVERLFEEYLSDDENFSYRPSLLHGDLEGGLAILFSPEKHGVAGIIDFGNIQINDPDYDLWRLYSHYGQQFIEAMLKVYAHKDHERLFKKLDFARRAQSLHRVVRPIRLADPESIEISLDQFRQFTTSENL